MNKLVNILNLNKSHELLLYEWRNKDFFIEKSSSKKKVSVLEHKKWFNILLKSNNYCKIISYKSTPVGHIRIVKLKKNYAVTIYILPKYSGIGIGSFVLPFCCRDFLINAENKKIKIIAYILKNNLSSLRLFYKTGFKFEKQLKNQKLIKLFFNLNYDEKVNLLKYVKSYNKYKSSYKSLLWGSEHTQKIRFKIILKLLLDNGLNSQSYLLDIGCGNGDFYKYLKKNKLNTNYIGIDNNPYSINFLISTYKSLDKFKINSPFNENLFYKKKYDFIIASGLFTYFKNFASVNKLIKILFNNSKTCLIFNCLKNNNSKKNIANELTFNPNSILIKSKSISKKSFLIDNYLPNDFTIVMLK